MSLLPLGFMPRHWPPLLQRYEYLGTVGDLARSPVANAEDRRNRWFNRSTEAEAAICHFIRPVDARVVNRCLPAVLSVPRLGDDDYYPSTHWNVTHDDSPEPAWDRAM